MQRKPVRDPEIVYLQELNRRLKLQSKKIEKKTKQKLQEQHLESLINETLVLITEVRTYFQRYHANERAQFIHEEESSKSGANTPFATPIDTSYQIASYSNSG